MEQVVIEPHGLTRVCGQTLAKVEKERDGSKADPRTLVSTGPDWSFLFKSYLAFIEEEFTNDLEHVEKAKRKLYAYVVSFVKGRPPQIVRSVTDTDGFRAWQRLCREDKAERAWNHPGIGGLSAVREGQDPGGDYEVREAGRQVRTTGRKLLG